MMYTPSMSDWHIIAQEMEAAAVKYEASAFRICELEESDEFGNAIMGQRVMAEACRKISQAAYANVEAFNSSDPDPAR